MVGLTQAADASFITYTSDTYFVTNDNVCVQEAVQAITKDNVTRLVWPVVALFPEQEWAKCMNKRRWSIIMEIVKMFEPNPEVIYTIVNESIAAFTLENHVGTHKFFVNSKFISLNCSTSVESDVDISFFAPAEEFTKAVKVVLNNQIDGDWKFDKTRINDATISQMQNALTAMFDVEFFSKDHAFIGNNAIVDHKKKLVPVMSEETWYLSQSRLQKNIPPGSFTFFIYPEDDLYRDTIHTYSQDTETRVDTPNQFLMESDGYYTRPAYMYVADPYSLAHDDPELSKTNVEVVRNSYRALVMVILENLGFAMEYVDPEKHGLCPTLQSRAKKIAKYADRVSQALADISVILKNNEAEKLVDFKWWELARHGRDAEKGPSAIREAFNLDPDAKTSMHGNTELLRKILESQIIALLSQLKNTNSIVSNDIQKRKQRANIRGGGDATSTASRYSWAGLGLIVMVISSLWPR